MVKINIFKPICAIEDANNPKKSHFYVDTLYGTSHARFHDFKPHNVGLREKRCHLGLKISAVNPLQEQQGRPAAYSSLHSRINSYRAVLGRKLRFKLWTIKWHRVEFSRCCGVGWPGGV